MYPMAGANLAQLFLEGLTEILQYGIYFALVVLIAFAKRRVPGIIKIMLVSVTAAAGLCYLLWVSTKTESMMSLMFAVLLVFEIRILDMSDCDRTDSMLMFTALLVPQRLFNSGSGIWGDGILYLVIGAVLVVFDKFVQNRRNIGHISRYAVFTYLTLSAFLFRWIEEINVEAYYIKHIIGRYTFAGIEVITVAIFCLFTLWLKNSIYSRIQILEVTERKYPGMKKWVLGFEIVTVTLILMMPLPFFFTRTMSSVLEKYLALLDILFLMIQLVYIGLLYKVTEYQHTIKLLGQEKEYYSLLNQNLEDMQDLRHDVKNIFLTMTAFVERSNDEEMKNFYHENIYPFAQDEIEQNTLFAKLQAMPSEELRGFLYMKFSQILRKKVHLDFSMAVEKNEFRYGMELVDLTRILGILMDNAMEECEGSENGCISVKILMKEAGISYTIKNSIRPDHDFSHFVNGKSDKEGHMGRGLKIVKRILEGYPRVNLNTVVDKDVFIQNLTIC